MLYFQLASLVADISLPATELLTHSAALES
jgi:hypothetical protein